MESVFPQLPTHLHFFLQQGNCLCVIKCWILSTTASEIWACFKLSWILFFPNPFEKTFSVTVWLIWKDAYGAGFTAHHQAIGELHSHSCAGSPGSPELSGNTVSPPPHPQATLHIGDHITTTGGGACVCVCGFRLRRCPCAHPRTTPGPEVPVCQRLYCLRACAWAQSMHIWVCERERRCKQDETHKGAESLAWHTYDETQSGWLTESVRGGATVAVIVFQESKSQRDLPIRWGHSSSHIDFGGLSKSDFPLRAAETGSAIHPFVCVCVHAQQRDNTGKYTEWGASNWNGSNIHQTWKIGSQVETSPIEHHIKLCKTQSASHMSSNYHPLLPSSSPLFTFLFNFEFLFVYFPVYWYASIIHFIPSDSIFLCGYTINICHLISCSYSC